ncbi:MAG: hypothetical protein ACRDVW_03695, partial [Acidimicrobiales bacterium]
MTDSISGVPETEATGLDDSPRGEPQDNGVAAPPEAIGAGGLPRPRIGDTRPAPPPPRPVLRPVAGGGAAAGDAAGDASTGLAVVGNRPDAEPAGPEETV